MNESNRRNVALNIYKGLSFRKWKPYEEIEILVNITQRQGWIECSAHNIFCMKQFWFHSTSSERKMNIWLGCHKIKKMVNWKVPREDSEWEWESNLRTTLIFSGNLFDSSTHHLTSLKQSCQGWGQTPNANNPNALRFLWDLNLFNYSTW